MKKLFLTLILSLGFLPALLAQKARVPLAPLDGVAVGVESLETDPSRVPDYLRALAATLPDAAMPFAKLMRVTLTQGSLPPVRKAMMGYLIAARLKNDYAKQHFMRLLSTGSKDKALLSGFSEGESNSKLSPADTLAALYAVRLTNEIHGADEAFFAKLRGQYNDAEIVELTQTICTMNYFVRMCAAFGLQPEPWLASTTPKPLPAALEKNPAFVTLASDDEMRSGAKTIAPATDSAGGLGVGIPNSRRAMLRSPLLADAWNEYWGSVRKGATLPRPMQLQVSYAVSMANGCRYCTVHQVVGLRRTGVDISKLLAMQKDDSALTKEELVAVVFARKLTKSPDRVTDADFTVLQTALPSKWAFEVVLQTSAFAYMNRFTDGLRLPSEDEAVKVYREVYGDAPPLTPRTAGDTRRVGESAKAK